MLLVARLTQRLSRLLQSGIGFFRYLIPDLPWVFLAVNFPGSKKHLRRRPGLPRSASITGSVRSRLDAGGFIVPAALYSCRWKTAGGTAGEVLRAQSSQ